MGASEADGLRGKWLRRAALAVLLRTGRPQTIGQVLHAVVRLYGPVAGPAPNKLVADALGREVRRGGPGGSRHLRRRHDQPKFEMAAAQRAVRPTTLTPRSSAGRSPSRRRSTATVERMFVLGIDPGLSRCGYGLVSRSGTTSALTAESAGVIETDPRAPLPDRLW